MFARHALPVSLLVSFAAIGCLPVGSDGGSGGTNVHQDIAEYEKLEKLLEAHRTVFHGPGADALNGLGTTLYWLEFPTYDPSLHSFDTSTNKQINYTFSIGTGQAYDYKQSRSMIVTHHEANGQTVFEAYAIDSPRTLLGSIAVSIPSVDVKWWPYAPDGNSIYFVMPSGAQTGIFKWTLGDTTTTKLFTLEQIGVHPGVFGDIVADQGIAIFTEGSPARVWSLDLAKQKATWLKNKIECDVANFDKNGVFYGNTEGSQVGDPAYFSFADGSVTDIAQAIKKSGYDMNPTYKQAGYYDSEIAMNAFDLGYRGQSGLFTYNVQTGIERPILLDARDLSTYYTNPVFLEDGSVFVTGLQSNEGDIGVDGPVYRVDFAF